MGTLSALNVWLTGFFALASVHYGIQWWFSRYERVFLVFSIQCALYTAFCWVNVSLVQAATAPEFQASLGRLITLALGAFAVILQFYACVGGRRDHAFRAIVTLVLVALVGLNQWVPLRGTVIALEAIQLPGGQTAWLPIRTPPSALLALMYLTTTTVTGYGLFVARTLWRRDRTGGLLIAISASAILTGATIGFLVDFAKLRAPFPGALPHALFVLSMALFLAREYSARGARVAATERQFEAAFEHSPIGTALVAPDGRFLRVNRALSPLLGSTAEEICSRRLHDIVRDDDEGSIEAETRRLFAGEIQTYTLEKRLVRNGGAPRWALVSVSVIPDERGQPLHLIARVQDVTEVRVYRERLEELVATRTRELREAKDEAERASQAKSRFLAHMSHEIRNPLHPILLTAELGLDATLSAQQRNDLETILKSGKHLATLLDEVLGMSKIEGGHPDLVEDPFDLGATLDEVAQMFAGQAAANGIELRIEPAPELPRSLLGDGGKVKQVLINLVSNAFKFTRQGSICITAAWRPTADEASLLEIVVADTGIGIAEQDHERLFDPFEQLDAGASAGGTGLGLAISLAYARLMGGEILVESTPAVGSRFKFTFVAKGLPPEAARDVSRPKLFAPAAGRYKVLIVDDMEINRDLLAQLLPENAFETRAAADGPAALSIDVDWSPDVVLMDLRMPGMNGLETIRRLRAAGSRAAIVALTAGAFGDDERDALGVGADFFIRKPYSKRVLLDGVARVLDARDTAS